MGRVIAFFVGLFIGGVFGFICAALCGQQEERTERSNWIDKEFVIYSLKRLKIEPLDEDAVHHVLASAANEAIDACIKIVERVPTDMPMPESWKGERDD